MRLDLNNLPTDPELLQRAVRDIAAPIDHRDTEIERLKSIIKQLQRMQFAAAWIRSKYSTAFSTVSFCRGRGSWSVNFAAETESAICLTASGTT
jgi:hypothetical protein